MLMYTQKMYWRGETYYKKNKNSVFIPNLKEKLNPNEDR